MKTKLFIFLVALILCLPRGAHAQPNVFAYQQSYKSLKDFNGDISKYLAYNFIDIKETFEGRKLLSILNKLEIKFDTYVPMISFSPKGINGVNFFFKNDSTSGQKKAKYPVLRIKFQNILPIDSAFKLVKKNNKEWTSDEVSFYGDAEIESVGPSNDIQMPK